MRIIVLCITFEVYYKYLKFSWSKAKFLAFIYSNPHSQQFLLFLLLYQLMTSLFIQLTKRHQSLLISPSPPTHWLQLIEHVLLISAQRGLLNSILSYFSLLNLCTLFLITVSVPSLSAPPGVTQPPALCLKHGSDNGIGL